MYVAYLRSIEKKPRCGEGWVSKPTLRLYGRRGLTRYQDYRIFAFKYLTVRTYLNLVLDFNKQLNCTCCVKLFRLKGIILSRDIFDYCRSDSWVTGVYYIYKEFLTPTCIFLKNQENLWWTLLSPVPEYTWRIKRTFDKPCSLQLMSIPGRSGEHLMNPFFDLKNTAIDEFLSFFRL